MVLVIPEAVFGDRESGRTGGSLSWLVVLSDEGPGDKTVSAHILLITRGAGGRVCSASG